MIKEKALQGLNCYANALFTFGIAESFGAVFLTQIALSTGLFYEANFAMSNLMGLSGFAGAYLVHIAYLIMVLIIYKKIPYKFKGCYGLVIALWFAVDFWHDFFTVLPVL